MCKGKIEQTMDSITSTVINKNEKGIFIQKVDKEGRTHFINEKYIDGKLIERREIII